MKVIQCLSLKVTHIQRCVTPGTAARQAPLSLGSSRQEHWSGLPCPPPADRPNPGIKPGSPDLSSFGFTSFWSLPYSISCYLRITNTGWMRHRKPQSFHRIKRARPRPHLGTKARPRAVGRGTGGRSGRGGPRGCRQCHPRLPQRLAEGAYRGRPRSRRWAWADTERTRL